MSIAKKVNICCSKCGKLFETTVFESVNSNYTKDIAKQIMSGSLFEAECPHCKYMSHLEYDTLYHDMEHNAMIWVVHKESSNYESMISDIRSIKNLPYKTMRIVEGMNALKEKVSCLENYRDDRVIELCKVFLAYDIFSKKPDFEFENAFYSIIDGDEKIWFYENEDNGIYCNLSNDIYDKVKDLYYDSPYLMQFDNNYPIIDYSWAKNIFDSLVELESQNTSTDSKYEKIDDMLKNAVICPKCNVQLPDDSIFCPNCGCNIEEEKQLIEKQKVEKHTQEKETIVVQKSPTNKKLVVLVIVLSICCCALGFYTFSLSNRITDALNDGTNSNNSNSIDLLSKNEESLAIIEELRAENEELNEQVERLKEKYNGTSLARDILNVLKKSDNLGYATENFHANTGIIYAKSHGSKETIKITMNYSSTTCSMDNSNISSANVYWSDKTWNYGEVAEVYIEPKSKGISILTFTNNAYDTSFKVLVIVE